MRTLKTKASRIRLPFFLLIKKRKEKKEKRKDYASAISPFSFLVSYFKRYYMMPRSRSSSCHFQAVLSESSSV